MADNPYANTDAGIQTIVDGYTKDHGSVTNTADEPFKSTGSQAADATADQRAIRVYTFSDGSQLRVRLSGKGAGNADSPAVVVGFGKEPTKPQPETVESAPNTPYWFVRGADGKINPVKNPNYDASTDKRSPQERAKDEQDLKERTANQSSTGYFESNTERDARLKGNTNQNNQTTAAQAALDAQAKTQKLNEMRTILDQQVASGAIDAANHDRQLKAYYDEAQVAISYANLVQKQEDSKQQGEATRFTGDVNQRGQDTAQADARLNAAKDLYSNTFSQVSKLNADLPSGSGAGGAAFPLLLKMAYNYAQQFGGLKDTPRVAPPDNGYMAGKAQSPVPTAPRAPGDLTIPNPITQGVNTQGAAGPQLQNPAPAPPPSPPQPGDSTHGPFDPPGYGPQTVSPPPVLDPNRPPAPLQSDTPLPQRTIDTQNGVLSPTDQAPSQYDPNTAVPPAVTQLQQQEPLNAMLARLGLPAL